jgi:hypothetical protein
MTAAPPPPTDRIRALPRRAGTPPRRAAARTQGRPRGPDHRRGRQDPLRGLGEVQEMIDICDFALGLSRQLYGLTIATERPGHRMMETWHPLGVVGVISAFNFPVAVWSWNAALALVCGDCVVWKPSEKTPLVALAASRCSDRAARLRRRAGRQVHRLCSATASVGESWSTIRGWRWSRHRLDPDGPRGRPRVAASAPAALLELGGNNAMIVARRPTSTWRCAASCSRPSARPASAARPCAACSCMTRVYRRRTARPPEAPPTAGADRQPAGEGTLVGPLIDRAAHDGCRRRSSGRGGRRQARRRQTVAANDAPDAFYVAGDRARCRADRRRAPRRPSRRSSTCSPTTSSTRRSRCTTTCRRGCRRRSSPRPARGRAVPGRRRFGLRHRQRQHRHVRRRDRRRVRRREGDRRRPRVGLRRVAGLHATRHQHRELLRPRVWRWRWTRPSWPWNTSRSLGRRSRPCSRGTAPWPDRRRASACPNASAPWVAWASRPRCPRGARI